MRFGQQNERERADDEPPRADRDERARGETEREGDLKNEIRRVARAERRERRVGRDDDRIVVHARERLLEEVSAFERERGRDETFHRTRSAMPRTNSTTARSI